jgi:hypothetical protein
MTGFETYKLYLALNNHFFQINYDYFRYAGGVPLKVETYENKRPDEKHRYDRLGKKFHTLEELENFLVANLIESKKRLWVGALFGGDSDSVYNKWIGRTQSINYTLVSELKRLLDETDNFNKLFECTDNQHPEILKAQMRGDLTMESFVFLDLCIHFIDGIDKKIADDRNWMSVRHRAIKYRPFLQRLNIDVPALRKAIQTAVQDMGVTS